MESILSAFIWKGPSMQTTGAKVAWAKICRPVQEGGLGLKSISHWNRVAVGKLLWGLITNKTSLWASWIHTVRLRGRSFWNVQIPNSCSWSWRQILHARNWCKHHIRWCIGNGESSFLWQDNWLPSGSEIGNIISPRQLAHTGLSWNAKVAEIVRGRAWQFPTGVSSLDTVWQTIDYLPNSNQEDTFLWKGTSSGIYTIQSAWELTRPHHNTCMAHEFIWHVGHIPRQAFIVCG
ncbi:hypothetical protein OIU77_028362 [Salix suchowensis]|uniref:Uncharacterized protein n=1 Tax=Salix suchowensis TaxID=1278906 RepID=A0ABQ9BH43_9ROSI|nr:hypothetical protein OIU77_028362 [Salix suchowensis]